MLKNKFINYLSADISGRQSSFSAFFIEFKFVGKLWFEGAPALFSKPNTFMAATITLDVNTTEKKSRFARYEEWVSLVTFLLFIRVRSANMVQTSTSDFPLKNLE